jgi:hypothetical protein
MLMSKNPVHKFKPLDTTHCAKSIDCIPASIYIHNRIHNTNQGFCANWPAELLSWRTIGVEGAISVDDEWRSEAGPGTGLEVEGTCSVGAAPPQMSTIATNWGAAVILRRCSSSLAPSLLAAGCCCCCWRTALRHTGVHPPLQSQPPMPTPSRLGAPNSTRTSLNCNLAPRSHGGMQISICATPILIRFYFALRQSTHEMKTREGGRGGPFF